ncbi:hypothetical protein JOF41_001396 [Saccharothrix coeruleofusca]|uniref:DUF742 domain-containing protein n=1 Tax=Saccharothrix coeruleofusca TaxID=33919 RepID=UPI001AE4017E|nr:DUF742 domain-containing protein [Saccharothrix coeruleofusca]MBP2335218.1 hypothetical protein [Saccharothrix coeruleofusca]
MGTASSDSQPTGGRKRRRSSRGEVGATGARFGSPALRRSLDQEPPQEEPPPKPAKPRRSLRGEVGATGARFGSAALRRSLESEERVEPVGQAEQTAPFTDPFADDPLDVMPPVELDPKPEPEPEPEPEPPHSLVRPYARTGGRTTTRYDLRLETLVSLEANGITTAMRDTSAEQRSIVEVCASAPRSVAEVSALLSMPLGVTKVLLGDLIAMGVMAVHDNAAAPGGPDLPLLERVLAGLRRL